MSDLELTSLDAAAIARAVRAREVSALAVIEAHLAAIARENPRVNAICTVAADHALGAARRLDAELAAGAAPGPLAGVPVGIKDVTPTAGIRTTYGSPLFADHVPAEDALVVRRLKAAGAIVIGKTNTPEFAAGANTVNALFGPTRNPWNPALSASGSTGGGAAALACGMIALAEGTDLGGSLRTPAAFCGVVGLRPSPGLVPRHPTTLPWDTLTVTGPMARRVEDAALMLQAIAGPSPHSPLVVAVEGRDFRAAARAGIEPGLRLAYCRDIAGIGVDPEIEALCRESAFELSAAGAVVEEVEFDLAFASAAFLRLRGQFMVERHFDKLDKLDRLNPNLAGNIRLGLAQSPRDVALGALGRAQLLARFGDFFERHDRLLTPASAVPPFPVEQNYPAEVGGRKMETYIDWIAPTFLVTLAGLPAISVPCGLTTAGLPVGLQIVGQRWGEEGVLALARLIEEAHPMGLPHAARQGGRR
ncbi:MAG: amidase [Pseudomonadota bacterium]